MTRIGLALIVLSLLSFYLFRINSPEARYEQYPYQYQYIYNQSGPIDVAIMGGSRTMRGFNAPYLADLVRVETKNHPIIYDLSRSGRGMDANYVILRDLLEERSVKLLLVEYNDTVPFNEVHPNFFRLAKFSDLFAEPVTYPESLLRGMQKAGGHISSKIGDNLHLIRKGYKNKSLPPMPAATSDYSFPTTISPQKLEAREHLKNSWQDQVHRSWPLFSDLEFHQSYYVKKLVALAQNRGTRIIFYQMPAIYWPPFSKDFIQMFEKEFGVSFIQPDIETLKNLYSEGYADPSHLRKEGSDIYMQWIAKQIAPILHGGSDVY